MRNTILSITLGILSLITFPLTADNGLIPVEETLSHLGTEELSTLLSSGEISREIENGSELIYLSSTEKEAGIEEIRQDMKKYFGIEALFYVESMQTVGTEEEIDNLLLEIYNLSRGVSTLKGADYYSASRGYRRILIHQFYRIEKSRSRTPLPDPLVDTIPGDDSFLVFQEDSTFGKDEYEIRYRYEKPVIDLTMKNMTALNYSIMPIAGREKLFMNVRITPVAEGYLFYGACLVEGTKVPVPGKNINDSLYNRVKALTEWFSRRLMVDGGE